MPDTTEQKMISDMPLPMPRLVMSSPIHIRRAVPAVREVTMSRTLVGLHTVTRLMLDPPVSPPPPLWNRKVNPVACRMAMPMVT